VKRIFPAWTIHGGLSRNPNMDDLIYETFAGA
jgi:hypothetical protein